MRMWSRRSKATAAGLAVTLAAPVLASCSAGPTGGEAPPDRKITVWTQENLPARMAATRKVVGRFEKRTGIDVDLVGVDEGQLPKLIMSAAAAGNLPDVIAALPLGQTWQMYSNGLLDTGLADDIVKDLGPGTFNADALRLASDRGIPLAVPSDAWLQLLVYRKALFEEAGLPAPDSYGSLLKAARKLDRGRMDGISVAAQGPRRDDRRTDAAGGSGPRGRRGSHRPQGVAPVNVTTEDRTGPRPRRAATAAARENRAGLAFVTPTFVVVLVVVVLPILWTVRSPSSTPSSSTSRA